MSKPHSVFTPGTLSITIIDAVLINDTDMFNMDPYTIIEV